MDDIRLKEEAMELDGKTFRLRCNFNVLADAQKYYGDFRHLNDGALTFDRARVYLSFMMNDYAEEMGWEQRYTPQKAGRLMGTTFDEVNKQVALITRLVISAVIAGGEAEPSASVNP